MSDTVEERRKRPLDNDVLTPRTQAEVQSDLLSKDALVVAFDLLRGDDAGIAFGGDTHYCIGATLARLEGRIAIDSLLSHFPEMELARPAVFAPHLSIRKMSSSPVRLRPARG
ncbi:hypothetical protein WMF28_33770 [Sorangium sp. So ce590]|uniref:hypothetical protein n=1 Tax=Sorangium sp. So ce590 TaxID=3133317 RepID=UPI003F62650A